MTRFELASGREINPLLIGVGLAFMAGVWQGLTGEWRATLLWPTLALITGVIGPHISVWFVDTLCTIIDIWQRQGQEEHEATSRQDVAATDLPLPLPEDPAPATAEELAAHAAKQAALRLLEASIRHPEFGATSIRIAGHRKLVGEFADQRKWQAAVDSLRGHLVMVQGGVPDKQGTYVMRYPTAQALHGAIERGEVVARAQQ